MRDRLMNMCILKTTLYVITINSLHAIPTSVLRYYPVAPPSCSIFPPRRAPNPCADKSAVWTHCTTWNPVGHQMAHVRIQSSSQPVSGSLVCAIICTARCTYLSPRTALPAGSRTRPRSWDGRGRIWRRLHWTISAWQHWTDPHCLGRPIRKWVCYCCCRVVEGTCQQASLLTLKSKSWIVLNIIWR